jgi:predicted nuclease of predicted toxin-antitoxin system
VKFLVDAHLPFALCALLKQHGMDAVHTRELTAQNATSDAIINELSIQQKRIVISKDTDFYYSHLLYGKPFKLVLVRIGNLDRKNLIELFARHLDEVIGLLQDNTLVEIDRGTVKVVS